MMKNLKNAGTRTCFAAVFTCVIYDVYNVLQSEQKLGWSFNTTDVIQAYGLSEKANKDHGNVLFTLKKKHILVAPIFRTKSVFRQFLPGAHDHLRKLHNDAMKHINKYCQNA